MHLYGSARPASLLDSLNVDGVHNKQASIITQDKADILLLHIILAYALSTMVTAQHPAHCMHRIVATTVTLLASSCHHRRNQPPNVPGFRVPCLNVPYSLFCKQQLLSPSRPVDRSPQLRSSPVS